MAFENIIGNNQIKELLTNIALKNAISHSYLFIGKEGIGKKKFAKEFAKMILCQSEEAKPCDGCKSCLEFAGNNNPDFNIIEPDGNSIKIEQIRLLQNKVYEKPIISNRKVYIIDEAENMTKEAQNCLLKTLEEPSNYITIILICGTESSLLNTIKSRCIKVVFNKINDSELIKFLSENYGMQNSNTSIIKAYDGSIGEAILTKNKKSEYEEIYNLITSLEKKDIIDILNMSEVLYKNKEDIFEFLNYINIVLFDLSIENKYNNRYLNCINICERTKNKLKSNNNFDISIDDLVISIWEEINDKYSRSTF